MRDDEKVRAKFRSARSEKVGFVYYIRAMIQEESGRIADKFLGSARSERDAWAEAAKKIEGEA